MAFVFVDPVDSSMIYPYTFRRFKADNPGPSFPDDYFTNPIYASDLAGYNVYPVVDNPPTFDPDTQRLVEGAVLFVDPDYVLQYTVEDLTTDEIDDRESRSADWTRFCRRLLNNNRSPYRQLQVWALDASKVRYHNYLNDISVVVGCLRKVRQLRNVLEALKADMGSDAFTTPQITEMNTLIGLLNVNWTWEDL